MKEVAVLFSRCAEASDAAREPILARIMKWALSHLEANRKDLKVSPLLCNVDQVNL
jgi:hypothetical protein